MIQLLIIFGLSAPLCYAFPQGAPLQACDTMMPQHSTNQVSTDPFPYTIKVEVKPGASDSEIFVEITTNTIDYFKGFLFQLRAMQSNQLLEGSWESVDGTGQPLDCSQIPKSSLTHVNNNPKVKANLKWKGRSQVDKVALGFVVVHIYAEFWKGTIENIDIRSAGAYTYPKENASTTLNNTETTPGHNEPGSPTKQPGEQPGSGGSPFEENPFGQSGQPGQHGQPGQPGQFGPPGQQPGQPGQQPGQPGQQPGQPGQQPGQPGQQPGQPGQQPGQPGQQPGQPGQQPGQPGQQPGQPGQQPGQQGQPGQPGQFPGQPDQPGQSGHPGQSDQPEQPGQFPGQNPSDPNVAIHGDISSVPPYQIDQNHQSGMGPDNKPHGNSPHSQPGDNNDHNAATHSTVPFIILTFLFVIAKQL